MPFMHSIVMPARTTINLACSNRIYSYQAYEYDTALVDNRSMIDKDTYRYKA